MRTVKFVCQCNGHACRQVILLPVDVAAKIKETAGHIVIVTGCPTGPSSTDTLVEEREGYNIYLRR